jgi:hypothetical protein
MVGSWFSISAHKGDGTVKRYAIFVRRESGEAWQPADGLGGGRLRNRLWSAPVWAVNELETIIEPSWWGITYRPTYEAMLAKMRRSDLTQTPPTLQDRQIFAVPAVVLTLADGGTILDPPRLV